MYAPWGHSSPTWGGYSSSHSTRSSSVRITMWHSRSPLYTTTTTTTTTTTVKTHNWSVISNTGCEKDIKYCYVSKRLTRKAQNSITSSKIPERIRPCVGKWFPRGICWTVAVPRRRTAHAAGHLVADKGKQLYAVRPLSSSMITPSLSRSMLAVVLVYLSLIPDAKYYYFKISLSSCWTIAS